MIRIVGASTGLSDRLRYLIIAEMRAQGVSQQQLAARVHVSAKHLSRLLNGHDGLSVDLADSLIRALDREWAVGTAPAAPGPGDRR